MGARKVEVGTFSRGRNPKMGRRRLSIVAISSALAVGIGVLAYGFMDDEKERSTPNAEAVYFFDVKDKRKLVGFAEQVFLGRVVEKVGSESKETTNPGTVIPQTQFSVDVLKVLKGEISGEIIVNQQGGYDPEDESTVLMEGDPLLKPGNTYLFTTKRDSQKGWLSIVAPGYADIMITSPEQRVDAIREFEEAVRSQELPRKP